MKQSFFEIIDCSAPKAVIQVKNLQFSSDELIKILQAIIIKKQAHNAQALFDDFFSRADKNLPKFISNPFKEIINPLTIRLLTLFGELISMENARPKSHVNWQVLDEKLLGIEGAVKELFDKNKMTIASFYTPLIYFFQSFLKKSKTKESIRACFSAKSIKPMLYQLIVNEFEECGITVEEGHLQEYDLNVLKTILKKISGLESILNQHFDSQEFSYLRDLAYLQSISTEDFHYFDAVENSWKKCILSKLSRIELIDLISLVRHPSEWNDGLGIHGNNLRLLALLVNLYSDRTKNPVSIQDMGSIMIAHKQILRECQWQIDANHISTPALLLMISLLCLSGNIVHLEQADNLLALQSKVGANWIFLKNLGINYQSYQTDSRSQIGFFCINTAKAHQNTYYFGSEIISFGRDDGLNSYLAQALLKIKRIVLQSFDSWYLRFGHLIQGSQSYRALLLVSIEQTWIRFHAQHLPYKNLSHADHRLAWFFQTYPLPKILQSTIEEWVKSADLIGSSLQTQELLKPLVEAIGKTYELSTDHNLGFFYPEYLQVTDQPNHVAEQLLCTFKIMPEGFAHYQLIARLHYDQISCLSSNLNPWIDEYLHRQIMTLRRLCPEAPIERNKIDQLACFIQKLAALPINAISSENIAAMRLSVNLFYCMESILPWSGESKLRTDIAYLTKIVSDKLLQSLGATILTELKWIETKDSFYLQWLVSNPVKRAGEAIYSAAEQLSTEPNNPTYLKNFLITIAEQQKLMHRYWFIAWIWFWGYKEIKEILVAAYVQVDKMVDLQLISGKLVQEAQEAAQSIEMIQNFHTRLKQVQVAADQQQAFQEVLRGIQLIETRYSGSAKLFELRAYIAANQQVFVKTERHYFYGARSCDQGAILINILDKGLRKLGQDTDTILINPNFLMEKAHDFKAKLSSIKNVFIYPGYVGHSFVDVWIVSDLAIRDFRTTAENIHYKRFYHANDLCNYQLALSESNFVENQTADDTFQNSVGLVVDDFGISEGNQHEHENRQCSC